MGSDQDIQQALQQRMNGLSGLLETDPGAFVRSLHALIEELILQSDPRFRRLTGLPALLEAFAAGRGAARRGGGARPATLSAQAAPGTVRAQTAPGTLRAQTAPGTVRAQTAPGTVRAVVSRIITEHASANRKGQGGAKIGREEARGAAHNFLQFCELAGIDSPAFEELRGSLLSWDRTAGAPMDAALREIQGELVGYQENNAALLSQTEAWAKDKHRLAELEGEAMRLGAELDREKSRADVETTPGTVRAETAPATVRAETAPATVRAEAEKLDALRNEMDRVSQEARKVAAQLETYTDLDRYVDLMSRFSLYTRTRMDYERSVMRLTPEQAEAVQGIRPGFDFLIRGGAGTGKTIVLLHALERFQRQQQSELELIPGTRVLFLTYTTTLVKYDRYVAEILRDNDSAGRIFTADGFFLGRLQELGRRQRVDYSIAARLAEKYNTTGFFSQQELAVEIEEFIFGGLVTRREYLEERIPRRGMRQPLSPAQREAVWNIRDKMVEEMEHDGALSKNYSRIVLIEHLLSRPQDAAIRNLDVAFVDESQDLSAADLRALKLMTRRGLVLAGDTGQSIYGVGSPYRRAAVDIAGRSRVLHTSFRNTVPIHELTEGYRKLSGLEDEEAEATVAFRDGPVPELYLAPTPRELARLLLRKAALFMDRLGYDPENLTVLAPTRTDLATVGDMLGHAGYRHADIRDEDFSFAEEKTIRLSTLHSSKGLDFAVVLLYLPSLPLRTDHDQKTGELLARNLIYVAMTRAMDNLNVFTLEGAHEGQQQEPLQDLVRLFRDYQRR